MRKQFKVTATLVAALAMPSLASFAQEQTEIQSEQIEITAVQIDDETGQGNAPMIFESVEQSTDGTSTSSMRIVAAESFELADSMPFGAGGAVFGGSSSDQFAMLSNPSVRKELELVDEQMQTIREVNSDFSKKLREAIGDLSKDGFGADKASLLKDTIANIQAEKKNAINDLLLPHQQERLEQVALQMRMKSRGTASTLGSDKVKEALGLSDEQIKNLKKRSGELKLSLIHI